MLSTLNVPAGCMRSCFTAPFGGVTQLHRPKGFPDRHRYGFGTHLNCQSSQSIPHSNRSDSTVLFNQCSQGCPVKDFPSKFRNPTPNTRLTNSVREARSRTPASAALREVRAFRWEGLSPVWSTCRPFTEGRYSLLHILPH